MAAHVAPKPVRQTSSVFKLGCSIFQKTNRPETNRSVKITPDISTQHHSCLASLPLAAITAFASKQRQSQSFAQYRSCCLLMSHLVFDLWQNSCPWTLHTVSQLYMERIKYVSGFPRPAHMSFWVSLGGTCLPLERVCGQNFPNQTNHTHTETHRQLDSGHAETWHLRGNKNRPLNTMLRSICIPILS